MSENKKRAPQTLLQFFHVKKKCKAENSEIFNNRDDQPSTSSVATACPTDKHNEVRNYNKSWEKKYSWLYFNEEKNGAFCKLCENYMKNNASLKQKTGGVFVILPFTNFKKALGKDGKLEKHEHSLHHTTSIEMEKLKIQGLRKPIHSQLYQQSEEEKIENRKSLKIFVRGLYYLIKEEIAHTTKYETLIENLLLKINDDLKKWKDAQSERATYCSKDTAVELLKSIGETLKCEIKSRIQNKKISLLADESTSNKNELELSLCVRYVESNVPKETFLSIIKVPNGLAETISDAIHVELTNLNLRYDDIISFGFDGASNFSGSKGGVRRKLSNNAGRDILYIHCRAHILSLAAASCRNKNVKVKRFFHLIKDLYKLFSKSPKKETILHEIQKVINDPVLKIPECIEVRWLSHFKVVNAVLRSLNSILLTCDHIHTDGADLASLAGGLLLEMRSESFIVTLVVMNEILSALSYLSIQLQKKDLRISEVIPLINSTKLNLKDIAAQCSKDNLDSDMRKRVKLCVDDVRGHRIVVDRDEEIEETFHNMKNYTECLLKEISNRFNDKAIHVLRVSAGFERFQDMINIKEEDILQFCSYFSELDASAVLADIKSYSFFVRSMIESGTFKPEDSPIEKILQTNIGYNGLKEMCNTLLCIPVSTASVERSFSSMNRILTKLRSRMSDSTLQHCMLISVEGPEAPTDEFLERVVDKYARDKPRRIRLI